MSRIACRLLACMIVATTSMCVMMEPIRKYWNIGQQCVMRGPFSGACKSQNNFNGELRCLVLACAFQRDDGSYLAVYTGPVLNGTLCGNNRVCENGVCVPKSPFDIHFPMEGGRKFNCLSPPVVEIPEYSPREFSAEKHRPAIIRSSSIGEQPSRMVPQDSRNSQDGWLARSATYGAYSG